MNSFIIKLFREMTDGFFVNIGNPEDTSFLETQFMWEGLYIKKLNSPLHNILETNRCPTLLHYVTFNEETNIIQVLKEFFDTVNNIPGWKRRIIMMRIPYTEYNIDILTTYYYTFILSEKNYEYYIHTIWDVLI
jgi:hypothetical protein